MRTPHIEVGIYMVADVTDVSDHKTFVFTRIPEGDQYHLDIMPSDFVDLLTSISRGGQLIFAQSVSPGMYMVRPAGRTIGGTG